MSADTAIPVAASTVAPSVQVVTAAAHTSVVTKLKADLQEVQADLDNAYSYIDKAWESHQVAFVTGLALLVGVLVGRFI